MLGLDTNILARYYISDETDSSTIQQRESARRLIESGEPLAVCKTVVLELEWVLRGYYGISRQDVVATLRHLLSLPHVKFEDRRAIERAIDNHDSGLDFADALHHASYSECTRVASFDDRGFARQSEKLKLQPKVQVPRLGGV